jgi:transcriptional regulator with XRE-family HTH domain
MTADEVLDALGRYAKDSIDSDRQTATKLGVRPLILEDWLSGKTRPQKAALARLAGFLRRAGYL